MRPLHRSILPAFLIAALSALPPAASAQTAPGGQGDKIDSRAIVTFVTGADASGKKYIAEGVKLEPLEQIIQMWIGEGDKTKVTELDLVVRSAALQPRLRALMSRWTTEGGLITRRRTGGDAVAFLDEAAEKAHQVAQDPRNKAEIDAAIRANDGAPAVPDPRETVDRARRIREAQHGNKDAFGPGREPEQNGGGGGQNPQPGEGGQPSPNPTTPTPPGGAKTQAQIEALAAELNAAEQVRRSQAGVKPVVGGGVENVEFQSLGSLEVAPAAGAGDKAASMWYSDSGTIAQDQATIRANLKDATLPTVSAINEGNTGAIQEFFRWLQSAKPDDMPTIDYAILPAGEVGTYQLGLLGKGSITLNHFIRNAEPRARSAVLVHELYHYWDKKIAKNYYANVSYGVIGEGTKHTHEYDAYLATSQYWAMVKRDGDNSPLAKLLERIPTDPGGVVQLVNGIAGK